MKIKRIICCTIFFICVVLINNLSFAICEGCKKSNSHASCTNKSYKYTWSTKTSLEGWERTGKTKTENGKEICE